jgi:hypothetical protein
MNKAYRPILATLAGKPFDSKKWGQSVTTAKATSRSSSVALGVPLASLTRGQFVFQDTARGYLTFNSRKAEPVEN